MIAAGLDPERIGAILFDVDVPLVTKKQWSALKIRAALRSAAVICMKALL